MECQRQIPISSMHELPMLESYMLKHLQPLSSHNNGFDSALILLLFWLHWSNSIKVFPYTQRS